jgi:hypothetical protein
MIEKRISTVSIGTGITSIYAVTPGRTAKIEQLIFTNSAASTRTVHVFDSSSATTGVTEISKIIIGATQTLRPAEIINKEIRLGYVTAYTAEGTEVTVDGYVDEI